MIRLEFLLQLLISTSDDITCDVAQWIGSGSGTEGGTFTDIINLERAATTNYLLSLYHGKSALIVLSPILITCPLQTLICSIRQIFAQPTLSL
jgi:hypothetical protein